MKRVLNLLLIALIIVLCSCCQNEDHVAIEKTLNIAKNSYSIGFIDGMEFIIEFTVAHNRAPTIDECRPITDSSANRYKELITGDVMPIKD
jgi:hypothetical protein